MIGGGIENYVAHGQLRPCLANVDGKTPLLVLVGSSRI